MTISQFLDLDPAVISKMKYDERKALVDEMAKKANRRLENLSKLPLPSPAFSNRMTGIREDNTFEYKPFQSAGKNSNQLANELKFLRSFLESDTSKVTGAKKNAIRLYGHLMDTKRPTYNEVASVMSYQNSKNFWEAYNKILQVNAGMIATRDGVTPGYISSSQVQEWVMKTMRENESLTPDEIEEKSRSFMTEIYEENVGKPRIAREYTTGKSRRSRKT